MRVEWLRFSLCNINLKLQGAMKRDVYTVPLTPVVRVLTTATLCLRFTADKKAGVGVFASRILSVCGTEFTNSTSSR
ncbi:hypothetical protein PC129_g16979 [Phytophthora cactorum]|uniref:Uncharacterized protein n=1 Tax=Phytophthora cactorum TaxID=29920 RepID=A0A8T1F5Z4_9STRA|nr:hypothetical protein Pcac1_g11236 [Phytophthora cactorum]KAG2805646.1 hypothetical protein PC112_g18185 [Phytophthora cactorum]KAG2807011.1 hypothetical protein PC111_g17116 [Phytophthora cactorum]KAG2878631.1 hypothetical protein PC114_g22992 [Phytophthora cactorum]KAG2968298.1 hypothetical protein PC118_g18095 [Phytophthora cactorum]